MAKQKKNLGWRKHDLIGLPESEALRTFSQCGESYDKAKFRDSRLLKRSVKNE